MPIRNLSALNRRQLHIVSNSPLLSATENRPLVESHCQLSASVTDSIHSESLL